MMSNTTPFSVFLIDDDDVACESVSRAFKKYDIPFPIITAQDGQEALQVLRGEHPSKSLQEPFVILLDLNMPRMNGFEFLQAVRADPLLAHCIIFVLTTSDDDNDRSRAYAENIAGYMVKSAVGPQFSRLTQLLQSYHSSVILPGKHYA